MEVHVEQLTNRQLLELIHRDQKEQTIEFKGLKKSHYELKDTVTELNHTVRGTTAERESGKGGMAKQVQNNTECIQIIKRKQYKITTWGVVIVTGLNIALLTVRSFIKNG
ncbi:hypothetical protein ES705_18742 [subsurface metagenome]